MAGHPSYRHHWIFCVGALAVQAALRWPELRKTNTVEHARASEPWLVVTSDGEGVRLIARNAGRAWPAAPSPGSALLRMRERVEALGGKLAVQAGAGLGFTIHAWLPSRASHAA